jgi:hypothetical protein
MFATEDWVIEKVRLVGPQVWASFGQGAEGRRGGERTARLSHTTFQPDRYHQQLTLHNVFFSSVSCGAPPVLSREGLKMALAIRNAARLKPEIQLSRALQAFEAILDHDQKAQFNEFRKESPPGASAPLAFTTLLDRSLQSRRSRRCIGPRVINLLQSTQQFSTVIDVLVGGSQNFLASSVWGILKLSLQVSCNF